MVTSSHLKFRETNDKAIHFRRHIDLAAEPGVVLAVWPHAKHGVLKGIGLTGGNLPIRVDKAVAGTTGARSTTIGVDARYALLHGICH
jgi:hypothetical protein